MSLWKTLDTIWWDVVDYEQEGLLVNEEKKLRNGIIMFDEIDLLIYHQLLLQMVLSK